MSETQEKISLKLAWMGDMTTIDGEPCSFRYGREFTVLSKRIDHTGVEVVRLLSDNGVEIELGAGAVATWFRPTIVLELECRRCGGSGTQSESTSCEDCKGSGKIR